MSGKANSLILANLGTLKILLALGLFPVKMGA